MCASLFKTTAFAVTLAFTGLAAATDLPAYFKQSAVGMGASIAADGSVTVGTTRFVPLLATQYDPASVPAGATLADCTLAADKVSYTCPGGLQFVPMLTTAGQMPHFSTGFSPMVGYRLASDFTPPAGFVLPAGLTLPTGTTIRPLTPADMIAQMEAVGMIPKGSVTFNSDGTVTTTLSGVSTTYTPTFMPMRAMQGLWAAGSSSYGVTARSDGSVVFPDGTTYAPRAAMMGGGMR
ncbi:MAG: hypothetical protein KGZ83_19100 [Sulfuricella sp.]|nr:hypothetical protein [Sulfuricella sp.]